MVDSDISDMKALYGDGFVGEPSNYGKNASANLDGWTYEQLNELEEKIAEKKKSFVCIDYLFILSRNGLPHLCCAKRVNGPYVINHYHDIFDDSYINKGGSDPIGTRLTDYLKANNIEFESEYCTKDNLAILWEPIRVAIVGAMLDREQEKLDVMRQTLIPSEGAKQKF